MYIHFDLVACHKQNNSIVDLVTPPAGESLHLWTGPFVESIGLDWSFDREAASPPSDTQDAESADEPAQDADAPAQSPDETATDTANA